MNSNFCLSISASGRWKQGAGSKRQEAGGRRLEAGSRRQEGGGRKEEVREATPSKKNIRFHWPID
ncbi:MAG TPA: hypothetical protein VHT72_10715 [Puia sp.]|nr:hypothetical protein [Puia sp.]